MTDFAASLNCSHFTICSRSVARCSSMSFMKRFPGWKALPANSNTRNCVLVLGPPGLLRRLRLLLLDERQDKASRVLVCDLLEGGDQAQHLQIFNSLGHGKDLIGKTEH